MTLATSILFVPPPPPGIVVSAQQEARDLFSSLECWLSSAPAPGIDRYWRGRADSPGSLAQGMLHRDGPGTEESSRFPPHEGRYVTPRVDRRGCGWIGSSRRNPLCR